MVRPLQMSSSIRIYGVDTDDGLDIRVLGQLRHTGVEIDVHIIRRVDDIVD